MRRGFFFAQQLFHLTPNRCATVARKKKLQLFFTPAVQQSTLFELICCSNRCATVAQRFFEIEFGQ
ncbi:MAG: hypothetical protein DRP56_10700 [Planctomycetota bacterium]|nr:MAG: hypothetical protein DRP56_10700 [Planctomycetota bacterium]